FTERGRGERVRVLLHSLAFGTLRPLVAKEAADELSQKQMEMTLDTMANSLVYWVQDLMRRDLLGSQGRIFAMTSTGSSLAWEGYGAVSAAKAALEAHCRQLALELGARGITANAICAGVADTPSMNKIPHADRLQSVAIRKNPSHRLTVPDDVANALVALAQPCTYWLNGNRLYADGGEAHSGSGPNGRGDRSHSDLVSPQPFTCRSRGASTAQKPLESPRSFLPCRSTAACARRTG